MDVNGRVLHSFTDVSWPRHLSLDSEGHVLVADKWNDRVLLLTSELQLQRVLIDRNSQVKPWVPERLCYNELTSQLYIAHNSSEELLFPPTDVISMFRLR